MGCLKLTYRSGSSHLKVVKGKSNISVKSYAGVYGYGFNGAEKDDEISGNGNVYDLGFREYDARLGRMFSIDPRAPEYPWQTPYAYHRNSPISSVDYMGGGDGDSTGVKTTYIASSVLKEFTVTADANRGTSEAEQYDYSGSFTQYKSDYPEFSGMSFSDASSSWDINYSESFFKEWDAAAQRDQDKRNVQKLGFFAYGFATISVVAAPSFAMRGLPSIKGLNIKPRGYTPPKAIHGNSLNSPRPTWGYKLYNNNGSFLKNGITSQLKPEARYTKAFMSDKYMGVKRLFQNRRSAYNWEYNQNVIQRGPLNKNMH